VNEYFNYFTEIEEHFQRARGTSLFLLSPLDWALLETWKSSGVPLEAVLRGIDAAFEKWRSRKSRVQMVNSVAYCTQAVMQEAQRMADGGSSASATVAQPPPFPEEDLRRYLRANADAIRTTGVAEFLQVAESIEQVLSTVTDLTTDLESLEQKLTVLEQRLIAMVRSRLSESQELELRQQLEVQLRPWKSKMTAPQIAMLEAQYLDRTILGMASLPRLSLFYLR
jgi:hypothetical protein